MPKPVSAEIRQVCLMLAPGIPVGQTKTKHETCFNCKKHIFDDDFTRQLDSRLQTLTYMPQIARRILRQQIHFIADNENRSFSANDLLDLWPNGTWKVGQVDHQNGQRKLIRYGRDKANVFLGRNRHVDHGVVVLQEVTALAGNGLDETL